LVDVLNQRLRSHGAMAGRPTIKSGAAYLGSIARQPQQSIGEQVYRRVQHLSTTLSGATLPDRLRILQSIRLSARSISRATTGS
jgi:hypothetical protein